MRPYPKVPLRQVDLSDQTFSVNFMPDLEKLRSSVRQVGLLHPVLLREKGDRCQIVSGFRRVTVSRDLGYDEIEAKVVGEKEIGDGGLFDIALHDNLTSRGLNRVEKALAIDKLVNMFNIDRTAVLQTYLPLFDLEANEKVLATFLSLAGMEEEIKRYVFQEDVSRSNIRRLSAFDGEDRKAVLPLLTSLKLGENSLREVLTLLGEIARRDQCSVRETVVLPDIQNVLVQPELTSSQKVEKVKKILMKLRYPRLSHLEEQFERKKKGLSLPPGVTLTPPPFFEGKGLRIGLQFQSLEAYRSILSFLAVIGEKTEFRELILPSPSRSEGGEELET